MQHTLYKEYTQEKKDLFFSNKIANFAIVEVMLN